ncbi:DNA polymerase III subunit gamma/tau [Clostridium folliculivorans]|uniref:DNA-directed DNA polymerase n=1 Tax=Clostridium folliculivorans TaxID=2886038 RepID=A0A9W5Y667_9CLOT|nr:DNA polymerase III subunit gamma/tau [Clostridium folliculivorans]GKU27373.1 DNA polymerase III subunit gamma/tau [Clostridium folliculivorans]GKU32224.1 DNA polymerase III subunit gamma/tau [Clostridium folliculivorans]
MAYTALYREWRPKKFEDVVGQEHITTTLRNQIINNRIAHAYLFCGTRGTGKTSSAKVFAKALNCLDLHDGEPCNKCEMCNKINNGLAIDITELDAASNNGVDKIRDIIDDVQYPPQEARFKVYIMDEVHMLSQGAVNAFLKTLEEPPKNVIFILATTDPQKLPITILSRCQRFDFKRIGKDDIAGHLRRIVKEQGVYADDKSLDLISRVSDGALRDSLSILDQAISMGNGKIAYEGLVSMLGLVTNEYLFNITDAIVERNIEKTMNIIEEIVFSGKDVHLFIKDLISHYRNLLMVKVTNTPDEVLDMSVENISFLKQQASRMRVEEVMRAIRILQESEESSKQSNQARIYLELASIKLCKIEYDTSKEVLLSRINKLEEIIKSGKIRVATPASGNVANNERSQGVSSEKSKLSPSKVQQEVHNSEGPSNHNEHSSVTIDDVKRAWKDIMEGFKARRAMVMYASLLTGKPVDVSNGIVTIEYEEQYSFNKVRLEKMEVSSTVDEVFSEILKDKVKVKYKVNKGEEETKDTEEILVDILGEDILEILDE